MSKCPICFDDPAGRRQPCAATRSVDLATLPAVAAPGVAWGYAEHFPLDACVWWRESTQEWILEVKGVIKDTHFTCRHPQPKSVAPEDVAGLPSLYAALDTPAPAMGGLVEAAGDLADAFAKQIGDRKHSAWPLIRRVRAALAKIKEPTP
jgi:hypothetical protein